jgi:hypothetical protein
LSPRRTGAGRLAWHPRMTCGPAPIHLARRRFRA